MPTRRNRSPNRSIAQFALLEVRLQVAAFHPSFRSESSSQSDGQWNQFHPPSAPALGNAQLSPIFDGRSTTLPASGALHCTWHPFSSLCRHTTFDLKPRHGASCLNAYEAPRPNPYGPCPRKFLRLRQISESKRELCFLHALISLLNPCRDKVRGRSECEDKDTSGNSSGGSENANPRQVATKCMGQLTNVRSLLTNWMPW